MQPYQQAISISSENTEQAITGKIGRLSVPSRLGVKTTLGPVTLLLDRLNHPEKAFPSIHIGGTSGKGSTSTILANILFAAGYKVGLFTKPHLQTVCERFVINQTPISPEAIMALLDRMPADLQESPTWFELMVALSFQYFANQQVDFGVIEVGLGGTYDATNVINPELSILTNVGLDHTDILGDTIEQIAKDKVGIIKPGKPVISGVSQPAVENIVNERCKSRKSKHILLGRDFSFSNVALEPGISVFDFTQAGLAIRNLSLPMAGLHQVMNASLAIAAALQLRDLGYTIPATAIRDGLSQTQLPGRMEILPGYPNIILDGAHSPPKMEALCSCLDNVFPDKKQVIGVLSFSKGHNAQKTLVPLASRLRMAIITEFSAETDYGNKRAQDPQEIALTIHKINPAVQIILEPDPICAIQLAMRYCDLSLICVTGSIFLVGQVRQFLTSVNGGSGVSYH